MDTLVVSPRPTPKDFKSARELAVSKAEERLPEPVIVAWKDDRTGKFAPEIPGAKGFRWHDYGRNFGGQLECDISNHYHFIFVDGSEYDKPDINLHSIPKKEGGYFLCINEACTDDDRKQFGAPYGGGLGDG